MAVTQTTILAADTTAASSSLIVVDANAVVAVGIFSAESGDLLLSASFNVVQITPGAPNVITQLSGNQKTVQLSGPGTYRVDRPALDGVAHGVFKDV